jgi:site-specific recombinase XerD
MSRVDAWYMVRRRARDAGIETAIGNHSFRAIGITDYLERGGDINIAKRMAVTRTSKRRNSTTGAATK